MSVWPASTTWADTLRTLADLYSLCSSARGPAGSFHIVRTSGTIVSVTTTSSVMLSQERVRAASVATRIVCDAASRVVAECGDRGLFTAALASGLVLRCAQLDLPLQDLLTALGRCLSVCSEWLRADSCPVAARVRWGSTRSIQSAVRACFVSKPACRLSSDDTTLLACLCTQAFLAALPRDCSVARVADAVRVWPLCGPPPSASFIRPHSVLLDTVLPDAVDESPSDHLRLCVLYECSIGGAPHAPASSAEGSWATSTASAAACARIVARLAALRVTLVLCQRLVSPPLTTALRAAGILSVQRVSARHVAAVAALTGATALSSEAAPLSADVVGVYRRVTAEVLCGTARALCIHGVGDVGGDVRPPLCLAPAHLKGVLDRTAPTVAVVLCNTGTLALQETVTTFKAALTTLTVLMRQPRVVAGCGAVEAALAAAVRATCTAGPRQVLVANEFASTLEGIVGALSHAPPPGPLDAVDSVCAQAACATARDALGWDALCDVPVVAARRRAPQGFRTAASSSSSGDSSNSSSSDDDDDSDSEPGVVCVRLPDPLVSVLFAVEAATEAAMAVLRVENTVLKKV